MDSFISLQQRHNPTYPFPFPFLLPHKQKATEFRILARKSRFDSSFKFSRPRNLWVLLSSRRRRFKGGLSCLSPVRCTDDGVPVYFDPDEAGEVDPEVERLARIENWNLGWAPWEAALSPEAEFAIYSLQEPEGQPLKDPKSLAAFEKLSRSKELGEKGEYALFPEQQIIKGHNGEDLHLLPRTSQWGKAEDDCNETTVWNGPLVFTFVPPRDWPPPGWKVDPQELSLIRGALPLLDAKIDPNALANAENDDVVKPSFPKYDLFLKQYNEWVKANKDGLDQEAKEVDPDYYPGRRRVDENYEAGMYELPFIYPGQIYQGYVTAVHLYEGAFVFFGCVHDGWVPIKRSDWFWIRQHIKVGMYVVVEVLAKRDPYRFRFPIELRFIDPNIDHLIFKRNKYPPIFQRDDTNFEELSRETRRPYVPRKRPEKNPQDEVIDRDHPYTKKIWQIHVSEQATLDKEEEEEETDEDDTDEAYSDDQNDCDEHIAEVAGDFDDLDSDEINWDAVRKKYEVKGDLDSEDKVYDSDEDGYWTWCEIDGTRFRRLVLTTDDKDMDLVAAREERFIFDLLQKQVEASGQEFVKPLTRRELQMEELDAMHRQRSLEQREALIRDIACRLELGLPVEEPGRYADEVLPPNTYNPMDKRFRPDYLKDTEEASEYFGQGKNKLEEEDQSFSDDEENFGDYKSYSEQPDY